jgi:drug/metabolite transporter (DMT)-like permease
MCERTMRAIVLRRLLLYGALLYVVTAWALNTILAKQAIEQMSPLGFTFFRFLVMTPLAFALALAFERRVHIERRDIPALLACGVCGFAAYQYFWILGLAHTTPFATSLIGALAPIFTLSAVAVLGHERVGGGRFAGAAIALFGIAIFEGAFNGAANAHLGDLLVLGSALVFAGYNVIGSRLMSRYGPLELLALSMTVGTVLLIPGGLPGLMHTNLMLMSWDVWWRLLYAILFPILLTYPVWTYAIAKIGAGKGSIFGFLVPVITGILSIPLLHTTFRPYELVGATVCLAGMLLAYLFGNLSLRYRRTPGASPPARFDR